MGRNRDPKEKKKVIPVSRNMNPENKLVKGPCDDGPRVRGNKAGKGRHHLPVGHPARCH